MPPLLIQQIEESTSKSPIPKIVTEPEDLSRKTSKRPLTEEIAAAVKRMRIYMDSQAKLGVDTEVMLQSPLVPPHLKLTTPTAQVFGASGEKKKTLPGIKIAGDTE